MDYLLPCSISGLKFLKVLDLQLNLTKNNVHVVAYTHWIVHSWQGTKGIFGSTSYRYCLLSGYIIVLRITIR